MEGREGSIEEMMAEGRGREGRDSRSSRPAAAQATCENPDDCTSNPTPARENIGHDKRSH
eukprot:3020890-Rhodomonas_salina.2